MNIAICYDESLLQKHLAQSGECGGIRSRLDTYGSAGELLNASNVYDLVLIDGATLRDMQRRSRTRSQGRRDKDEIYTVPVHGRELKLNRRDILYAENDLKKIILHTQTETVSFIGVMSRLEEELGDAFFRCHRGYLVNMEHVMSYSGDTVLMDNGDALYLSRRKYAEFDLRYRKFFG